MSLCDIKHLDPICILYGFDKTVQLLLRFIYAVCRLVELLGKLGFSFCNSNTNTLCVTVMEDHGTKMIYVTFLDFSTVIRKCVLWIFIVACLKKAIVFRDWKNKLLSKVICSNLSDFYLNRNKLITIALVKNRGL